MYYANSLSSDDNTSMALTVADRREPDSAPSVLDLFIAMEEELGCSIFEALRSYRDNQDK